MTGEVEVRVTTARTRRIMAALEEHGGMNSTAGWIGSPDPSDWHNIVRTCQCGERVSAHPWITANPKAEREAHRIHLAEMVGRAAR